MILDDILAAKASKVSHLADPHHKQMLRRAAKHAPPPRPFLAALRQPPAPRLIAEVKHASPSAGVLREPFDPEALAEAYTAAGAAAISVLTEEDFFLGGLEHLALVRRASPLPILRKDFLTLEGEILESRVSGADAVLLIVAILDQPRLEALLAAARSVDLAALVEVHDEGELRRALAAGAGLIGINNRDLRTFTVDVGVTERLAAQTPGGVTLVSESGYASAADMARARAAGVCAVLVGESLLRAADPGAQVRALLAQEKV